MPYCHSGGPSYNKGTKNLPCCPNVQKHILSISILKLVNFAGVIGKQIWLKNKNAIYIAAAAFHFFTIKKVKRHENALQYLIWCCIGANRTNWGIRAGFASLSCWKSFITALPCWQSQNHIWSKQECSFWKKKKLGNKSWKEI